MASKRRETTAVIWEGKRNWLHQLTWYMDRYKAQRQKNTTLSRRASTSMAPRLSAAPMRHNSSIAVCVSRPRWGPSHSRMGEDSSCSPRGLPLYRSCRRAGSSPSLPYRPRNRYKHRLQQHQLASHRAAKGLELTTGEMNTLLPKHICCWDVWMVMVASWLLQLSWQLDSQTEGHKLWCTLFSAGRRSVCMLHASPCVYSGFSVWLFTHLFNY